MIDAETPLLLACRQLLVEKLPISERDCENKFNGDQLEPIAGHEYIAVCPSSAMPGPRHRTCGGVFDLLLGVRVVVYQRCGEVPQDRLEQVFMHRLTGINKRLKQIADILDFGNPFLVRATEVYNGTVQYIEPLKFESLEMPEMVTYEAASANPMATNLDGVNLSFAMKRAIRFGGCRAMEGKDVA